MELDLRTRKSEVLVSLEGITKYYGDRLAVDNISFDVGKGEILGFLGPNGAGKTTSMRIITGYMPPTKGSVKVAGIDMLEKPVEAKKHIGYLPENPPIYTEMTVLSYLRFVAKLKKVPSNKIKERLDFVLQKCGLEQVKGRIIGNLSRGYKQRVGIAQAIIHDPEIIIFDEPTVGLDPQQVVEIRNLIKEISREKTVILSTHILSEVTKICDRVIIISQGRLVFGKYLDEIGEETEEKRIKVVIDGKEQIQMAYDIVSKISGVKKVSSEDSTLLVVSNQDIRKSIVEKLTEAKIIPLEVYREKPSLEEIYLKVVSA
ncbi:MAG: ABC transporter ATP-binding protein [Candidatus Calescibacterium sp.]|nr:ABC transporter ATP-binding protein [Candidatus Calescibacterium sp.]MCX7734108.1 ABC transporter ATP-binding protein [bacterium]MDW8087850.1 ATP-binding cassette domain-containing protein [Candidatus Calescibacterium sp.]